VSERSEERQRIRAIQSVEMDPMAGHGMRCPGRSRSRKKPPSPGFPVRGLLPNPKAEKRPQDKRGPTTRIAESSARSARPHRNPTRYAGVIARRSAALSMATMPAAFRHTSPPWPRATSSSGTSGANGRAYRDGSQLNAAQVRGIHRRAESSRNAPRAASKGTHAENHSANVHPP
jgi:hypothetical protein